MGPDRMIDDDAGDLGDDAPPMLVALILRRRSRVAPVPGTVPSISERGLLACPLAQNRRTLRGRPCARSRICPRTGDRLVGVVELDHQLGRPARKPGAEPAFCCGVGEVGSRCRSDLPRCRLVLSSGHRSGSRTRSGAISHGGPHRFGPVGRKTRTFLRGSHGFVESRPAGIAP